MDFVSNGIKRVTETGIEDNDGNHRGYDTIICATGFDTSYRPRIPIGTQPPLSAGLRAPKLTRYPLTRLLVGRNGTNVQDAWSNIPTHYMSMAIGPDFPNYFIVNGPNSSLGSGSLLVLFEREVDYIVEAIAKMQRENLKTMSVKQGAVDDFMEYVATYFQKTVYSEKCRSWYKAGKEEG